MNQINVFSLPYAGGSKYSYRGFCAAAPEGVRFIPLELPGHGSRFKEPLLVDMGRVVDDLYGQIEAQLKDPYVLYGHSMGTLTGYLLTRRIIAARGNLPLHLFFSGGAAPSVLHQDSKRHLLPREAFFNKIREYGGSPDEILRDEELMKFFEPILRADFQAIETYPYQKTLPFHVPVTVMLGTEEKTTRQQGEAWAEETTAEVEVIRFPGNHFFIFKHEPAIVNIIANKVKVNIKHSVL